MVQLSVLFTPLSKLNGLTQSIQLINWEWELSDDFSAMEREWCEEMLLLYKPYLRLKVKQEETKPCIM